MRLFPRTRDIQIEGVEEILASADEPARMLRLIIKDIEQALVEVRGREATLLREARHLTGNAESVERRQRELTERARHALVEDREDLARAALSEKHALMSDLAERRRSIDALKAKSSAIAAEVARLETVLAAARASRPSL